MLGKDFPFAKRNFWRMIRESFLEFPATCDYEFNDYLHDKCKDE